MKVANACGSDAWRVYNDWPAWFVNAALDAAPRLKAMESIRGAQVVSVGTGSFKHKETSRRLQQGWHREATGGGQAPKTKRGFENMMMGIGLPQRG